MNAVLRCLTAGLVTSAITASLAAAELRVIGWNVEDMGSWVKANEARLRQLAGQGFDLWGLSEVQAENFIHSLFVSYQYRID